MGGRWPPNVNLCPTGEKCFFFQNVHPVLHMGASINYVEKQGRGRGSPKCQRYYISLFRKLVNVVYGCLLWFNLVNVNYDLSIIALNFLK